ncbi:hypothetical protein DY218_27195 [Streptomyces triticagri]|uniref:Phage portal protein n=1 Tax=Streptomyces triticagri TaxID=2293568 RepID=A0A372LY50_9ACTN|nr:hypothetical protein [Streptomyces triticagri]RFU83596.1 hypothetical protein DY218_27195 [Streptomyces triticagri]
MAFWRLHRGRRETQLGIHNPADDVLLASAALTDKTQVRAATSRRQPWQKEAWDLYDQVPEIHYGVGWRAAACSRARLYVGRLDPDGSSAPAPVDSDETPGSDALLAPLLDLAGGPLGHAQLIKRLTIHYDVPGESWLLGTAKGPEGGNRWLLASNEEVTSTGGGELRVKDPDNPAEQIEFVPGRDTIVQLWRPHPKDASQPDSPMRSLRGTAKELLDISAHIQATAESRLAGAGLLKVPDGVDLPNPQQSEGPNPLHANPFIAALLQAMAAPLKNRDDASAIVPIIATGNPDALKAMEHLSFATEFDAQARELREAAVRRLSIGMDIPPEILLGMGDSNHWSAWLTEESAIKVHIEPMLQVMCDALTTHWYRPTLTAMGIENPDDWVVWYDIAGLKQRPNRTPEVAQAWRDGIVSDDTYRRELGLSGEDAPDAEEQRRRLLTEIARNNPALAPAALTALGIPIDLASVPAEPAATLTRPNGAPPAGLPGPGGGGRGEPPALPSSTPEPADTRQAASLALTSPDTWLTTCLDMAVRRALARAGQWLIHATPRSRRQTLQRMPRHEVHVTLRADRDQLDDMLRDAFAEFHDATPNEPCLHQAVDDYVRALLVAGQPHSRDHLPLLLRQSGCTEAAA